MFGHEGFKGPWLLALGYGCDPDDKRLDGYCNFIAYTALEHIRRFGAVNLVLSGGVTDLVKNPNTSEAGFMATKVYLALREKAAGCQIFVEGHSLTTIENLRFSRAGHFWTWGINGGKKEQLIPFLFTPGGIILDKDRAFKVKYLYKYIFRYEKKPDIFGYDFGRNLKEKIKIAGGTAKDIASMHIPALEKYFLGMRIREIRGW